MQDELKYYELSKADRLLKNDEIYNTVVLAVQTGEYKHICQYADHIDTYIRKVCYQAIAKAYKQNPSLQSQYILFLEITFDNNSERVRQTIINACGDIGEYDFESIKHILEKGLYDLHHSVKNAVTGSLKRAGDKNADAIKFCGEHIFSENPEVRKLVCHGLELRGRTHPEEILPILKHLQYDKVRKVIKMLIHVLGQISYKKGCFIYVMEAIQAWDNKEIYSLVKEESIEVHGRYEKFSEFTQEEVIEYFKK